MKDNALDKAYARAVRNVTKDPSMLSTMVSAGFICPNDSDEWKKRGRRTGYQVFVRVEKWSEALLKSDPITGGLVSLARKTKRVNK